MEILQILRRQVQAQVETLKETLASGSFADPAAYSRLCGCIEGLRKIEELIEETVEEWKRKNDE